MLEIAQGPTLLDCIYADTCFTAVLRSVLAGCYTQVPHRSTLCQHLATLVAVAGASAEPVPPPDGTAITEAKAVSPAGNNSPRPGPQSSVVTVTQTNTGDRRGTGAKPVGPDEEDTAIVHWDEAARSSAVVFRCGLWQTGQESGISVDASLAVPEGVVERGENLEPPLDSRIVISYFANAFKRLVIPEDAKLRTP